MAVGRESLAAAGLVLFRVKLWNSFDPLFGGRHAVRYAITDGRATHLEYFKVDMTILFHLLRQRAIHPAVVGCLPLAAARDAHKPKSEKIDRLPRLTTAKNDPQLKKVDVISKRREPRRLLARLAEYVVAIV